jgi:polysaccharide biosynthesis protein PslG
MTMNSKIGRRCLVATSLVVLLAAVGCTSNQYASNGQPTVVTPTYNHATTPGSSSGTEGIPPMASSYTYLTPRVDVDGLANLAAMQGYRGRILGPSGAQGYLPGVTATGGTLVSPALLTNPQATVNTSISSQPVPVITATEGGITIAAAGTTTTTGTNAATTAAATPTATTAALNSTTATTGALTTATGGGSTVAGSSVFSPALMNSTPAPQATGTVNPTLPTVVATGRAPTVRGTTITNVSSTSARTSAITMGTNSSTVSSGIRIETGSSGSLTVTNVSNNASSTGHH